MHSTTIVFIVICFYNLAGLDGQKSENMRLNFFDTDLLRYTAEDRKGNVMVSPASIKSTLAMILEGAVGKTADEIRSALRLSPDKQEFREQLNLYLSVLKADKSHGELRNANAVFISNKIKLKKDYDMVLRKIYLSDVRQIDFKDPYPASDVINKWVHNNTKGLISSIVEPVQINPASDVLLANALYFKNAWQHAFNPRSTSNGCFYHLGLCKTVAMMELYAELSYAYVDNLRSHAVELPYEGGRYSMVLLVPQEREGIGALIRDLPYMSLAQISRLLEPSDVMLMMPRFSVDYSEDMVGPLKAMRITTLFSPKANLSGIFEGGSSQINNVFHKVHMTVDEAGTVAAAATGAMVVPLIGNFVQLRVDHPFVFFIRDNITGLVLFEGKIEEPTVINVEQNVLHGLQEEKQNARNGSTKRSYG